MSDYKPEIWPKAAETKRYARMDPLGDTRWVNYLTALGYTAGGRQAVADLARYMPLYLKNGGHDGWLARQATVAPFFWLGADADPEAEQ